MSFQTALDRDMQTIMQDAQGVAVDAIFLDSATGESFEIRGLFSYAPLDLSAGSQSSPMLGNSPLVSLHVADIQSKINRKIISKDEITVNDKTYTCAAPRYNTYGMVTIKLLEKTGLPVVGFVGGTDGI